MTGSSDHTILQMALSDKRSAFDLAFNQHWQAIYTQAYRKVQSAALAKDLTQEVFMVLWDKFGDLATHSTLLPYLYGVLRNKILQQYEKDAVQLRYAISLVVTEPLETSQVEEWLQHKQLHAIVTEEIEKMPPRMKAVYALKKDENLSISEIAAKLDISEQTVKNQLQSAYNRLRLKLGDYRLPVIIIGIALGHQ